MKNKEFVTFLVPLHGEVFLPKGIYLVRFATKTTVIALKKAFENKEKVVLSNQQSDNGPESEFNNIGVLANIEDIVSTNKKTKNDDEIYMVTLKTLKRINIHSIQKNDDNILLCSCTPHETYTEDVKDYLDYYQKAKFLLSKIVELVGEELATQESITSIMNASIEDFPDSIMSVLKNLIDPNELYVRSLPILNYSSLGKRLEYVQALISEILHKENTKHEILHATHHNLSQEQKKHFLEAQIKTIQKELGIDDFNIDEYKKKLQKKKIPQKIIEKIERDLKKLSITNQNSPEYSNLINYMETILSLPWTANKNKEFNEDKVRNILDTQHFGLTNVKDRIIEYLSSDAYANKNKKDVKNVNIICLVGPPGVGKTSLAESISEALGKQLVRIPLGGVHDESEIRGHRRTYIGSMPGKIIRGMQNLQYNNPIILLDEIDKLGRNSAHGDPSAALLEVLDPEQNSKFTDHYLDIEYDLSKVFFITTANDRSSIPTPLLDRMEIIHIPSYLLKSKMEIAKKYLLPKIFKTYGISDKQFYITDEVIEDLITKYTFESGVRNLYRKLERLCQKATLDYHKGVNTFTVTRENLSQYLGAGHEGSLKVNENLYDVGVVNGLAYTSIGGDLLNIEVLTVKGRGHIQFTGKLGDVMLESAKIAQSYTKSLINKKTNDIDIHIHVPDGATPKDGPSAGIALTIALYSAITDTPIRQDVAMTGEITLRGKVLPIGGVREKVYAAIRKNIKTVILPLQNKVDVEDPENELIGHEKMIEIKYVKTFKEVMDIMIKKEQD